MRYTLNKFEMQEIEGTTILFLMDNNNNLIFEQCIVLEGTGKIFIDILLKCNNIDVAEEILFETFPDVNRNILQKDLDDFIVNLIDLNLLHWSNGDD